MDRVLPGKVCPILIGGGLGWVKAEDCSTGQAAASFQAGDAVKVRDGAASFATGGEYGVLGAHRYPLCDPGRGRKDAGQHSTRRRGHRVDQDGRSCKSIKEDTMEDMAVEVAALKQRQTVSEHRIADLEGEVRDIRTLTAAMARVDEKVDDLRGDVEEIKSDVKDITARPGKKWDKLVAAVIGAVGSALVASLLALILK